MPVKILCLGCGYTPSTKTLANPGVAHCLTLLQLAATPVASSLALL